VTGNNQEQYKDCRVLFTQCSLNNLTLLWLMVLKKVIKYKADLSPGRQTIHHFTCYNVLCNITHQL